MNVVNHRRSHLASTLPLVLAPLLLSVGWLTCLPAQGQTPTTTEAFAREVEQLPQEQPYDYHKQLSEGPVHAQRRDPEAQAQAGEMAIPDQGWTMVWNQQSKPVLGGAVRDFQDYLDKSMRVRVELDGRDSLEKHQELRQCIVVGTREQLPGCGTSLTGPKDYEIAATPDRITVCGFDERGAMFGLYNLEARMNLREAPFLPANLKTIRHSLYDVRMVQSWMGWMEWPDPLLAHLAHDGFDGIFASCYANPNGDRTTAENSTEFYARLMFRMRHQDPARMHDLIKRASRFGIKVYTPIIYQYLGTPESEAGLRKLVRDLVQEFPDIHGYVLLTEGFWYKQWGGGHGASKEYLQDWACNWSKAVGIVAEECHRVNPAIEVLPWEYNIDFRPQNVEMKRYFVQQLPADTIPLLTWENGKSFEIDGMKGYLRDYSISQVGPAEVTEAQIAEIRQRGMKVYSNADTFLCGAQLQTVPYHPFPYQWCDRYKALEKVGVNGTMESWSSGYTPNFMTELRAWTCWSDAPPVEELLGTIGARNFGAGEKDNILKAWDLFSQAIRLVPDTGPTMGTSSAIGNPLFFQEPPTRTATFKHSWTDHDAWMGYMGGEINPYWPFTVNRLVFMPDFTNGANKAESYARAVSGIEGAQNQRILPVFLKYLQLAADRMGDGLNLYRTAAMNGPASKRAGAVREVVVAEQIQRMLLSSHAVLEFEDLRLQLVAEKDAQKAVAILDRLETIVREEIARTELSLLAATRDSRLGFQFECDYVYTPYSLREKLKSLRETLEKQLLERRKKIVAEAIPVEPTDDASWVRVTESDVAIKIETDKLEAVIPKNTPKCWMTGIEKGSFLDKTTGFREAGDGLCCVDWLMEPGSDEPWRDQLKADDRYLFNNDYHGNLAKRMIEGPQLTGSKKEVRPEIIHGKDFVAVKTTYRYEYAAPNRNSGSLMTQWFVFPRGERYFFLMDKIDSVNDAEAMFLRTDMPGSLRHDRGETFSEVYLSYLGGPKGLRIPSNEFHGVFSPDAKFNYRRDTHAMPSHFIRAYRLRDPKTEKDGPWLAGITLEPSVVYEAWCNQRPGIAILIEEFGGRPIKAGESFSAAFVVGYFDTIDAMHTVNDRYKGHDAIGVDGSGWHLVSNQTQFLQSENNIPADSRAAASVNPQSNSIASKMVLIPAGEFMMGNHHTTDEDTTLFKQYGAELKADSFKDEYPCHRVRITKPFYMGAYHVTVGQFRRFADESGYKTDAEKDGKGAYAYDGKSWTEMPQCNWRNPGFPQTEDHPVVCISWNDATAFCEWICRKEGQNCRLPTEAEWEYACRAGTTTRYSCGDDPEGIAQVGNIGDAAAKVKFADLKSAIKANDGSVFTAPVGSFRPNAFGLHDMHGNAWQWCSDRYQRDYYAASPVDDPIGPSSGAPRATRGGSWYLGPDSSRSAARYGGAPDARYCDQGFRIVKNP